MRLCTAGIAGLLSHKLIFIVGEWHLQATNLLKLYVLSFVVLTIFEVRFDNASYFQALASSSELCGVYALCLGGSMVIYRTIFHPLRDFPGPLLARITKLWHVAHCLDSKNHLLMEKLYQKYGSFVRTGT